MTVSTEKLSAFLDGELAPQDMLEVERALEGDTKLQAELDALMHADDALKQHFDALLEAPVPLELAKGIEAFDVPQVANSTISPKPRLWVTSLAAAIALAVGVTGGFFLGQGTDHAGGQTQVAARGWLDDIASYHRVYAGQKRHLVEVPASEALHIQAWLSNTVGTEVAIPDLTSQGLTFEGARLLVAADKPVAQLMYTDADGAVVALCLTRTQTPIAGLNTRQIGDFDMVSWGAGTANFVLVGDHGREDLSEIAVQLASEA